MNIHETENSPVPEGLHINTFEFGRKGYLEVRSAKNQIMRREDVQNWIQGRLELARNVIATPAIRLLVAFTPDGTAAQDNATLRRRQLNCTRMVARNLSQPWKVFNFRIIYSRHLTTSYSIESLSGRPKWQKTLTQILISSVISASGSFR